MISKRHSIICVSKKMMIYALPGYGREPARLGLAGCASTVSMMPVTGARCELPRTPFGRSSRLRESLHSPTPIGPGAPDEGNSPTGYYAPTTRIGAEKALGHRGGAKPRAAPV